MKKDYRVKILQEKVFDEAFPVLKPYVFDKKVKEYIVDYKTGKRSRI